MNSVIHPRPTPRATLAAAVSLSSLLSVWSWAQAPVVSGAARAAQDLARYDKNKNGRLDADELAAQRADETKAAQAATANPPTEGGDSVVELSPFKLNPGADKGYIS